MDCIYLTTEQIEALYQLTQSKRAPMVGIQIQSTADARSNALVHSVLADRPNDLATAVIEPDGASPGWEF